MHADVLWIDEISQLDTALLSQINKLTYTNVQFLLSGDFNQFPPIGDSYRGSVIPEGTFQNSKLLHRLASGNRLTLTECRRSDTVLFDFYSSLTPGGVKYDEPLCDILQSAKETFTYSGPCRWNLVISHRRRVQINRELNHYFKPPGAIYLRTGLQHSRFGLNTPQSMWLWPGIELYACVPTERRGLRNQVLYTVESIGDDDIRLSCGIVLSYEEAKRYMRLSYAQTYASCQGTEFEGTLRLHDTGNKHFTKRHLFVGLSRGKRADEISVV